MSIYSLYAIFIISLGYMATDIYLPSLPAIASNLNASESGAQLTIFSYLLSFACAPLYFGPASDKFGRRKVIILGLILGMIGSLLSIYQSHIVGLILCRFLQGFGLGSSMIAARTILPDLFSGKEFVKQISYMTMALPIIVSLAPVLGGFLQENFGWRSIFIFLSIYIMLMLIMAYFSKETLKNPHDVSLRNIFKHYISILKNIPFILITACIAFITIAMFSYMTASPFLFQTLVGMSPSEYGMTSIYTGLAIVWSGFLNAKLASYVEPLHIICVSIGLILLAGFLILFFSLTNESITKWQLLGPIAIFFTCTPLGLANMVPLAFKNIKSRLGAANAFLTSTQFIAGSIGSLLFSFIPETSATPLSIAIIVCGLCSALLILAFNKTNSHKS